MKKFGGTLAISWGENGGFYYTRLSAATRLCLGRVALTYLPYDLDDMLLLAAGKNPADYDSERFTPVARAAQPKP